MADTQEKRPTVEISDAEKTENYLARRNDTLGANLAKLAPDILTVSVKAQGDMNQEIAALLKSGFLDKQTVKAIKGVYKKYTLLMGELKPPGSTNDADIIRNTAQNLPIGAYTSYLSLGQVEQMLKFTQGFYTLASGTKFINLKADSLQGNPKAAQKHILEAITSISYVLGAAKHTKEPPVGIAGTVARMIDDGMFGGKPVVQKSITLRASHNVGELTKGMRSDVRALLERDRVFALVAVATAAQLGVMLTMINKIVDIETKLTKAGTTKWKDNEKRSKKDETQMIAQEKKLEALNKQLEDAVHIRDNAIAGGNNAGRIAANKEIGRLNQQIYRVENTILRINLNEAPVDADIAELDQETAQNVALRRVLLRTMVLSFQKVISMKHMMQGMLTFQLAELAEMTEHEIDEINRIASMLADRAQIHAESKAARSGGQFDPKVIEIPKTE